MQHTAPFIQNLLLVGLIAGIVWKFHKPLYGLLEALQKRVESGSNIKAGPFEITEQLRPQDPVSQQQKAAAETLEVLEAQAQEQEAPEEKPLAERASTVQARYFQAEDLVLRAIQAEYGAPVKRQMAAGRDAGFDGVFYASHRANVVEVKYVPGRGHNQKLRAAVERLTATIQQYGWLNAQIILALVFETEEDIERVKELLSAAFLSNPIPVEVKTYAMFALEEQFGVSGKEKIVRVAHNTEVC